MNLIYSQLPKCPLYKGFTIFFQSANYFSLKKKKKNQKTWWMFSFHMNAYLLTQIISIVK